MVIKTSIGSVYEGKNKGGKITFYDDLSRSGVFVFKSKSGDTFTIKVQGLGKIKDIDTRPPFIEVTHNTENIPHKIRLVLDCTHNYKEYEEPHLNLTHPSTEVLKYCKICKKYFEELNHKFAFTISNSTDADMLWEQIKKHLKEKSFFNEYKLI